MSLFDHSEVPPTRFNGIRLSESVLGRTLPIVIGQQRVGWLLGWYGDFTSKQAQQSSGGGGSGLGKSGSPNYVYSASVLGFVCQGPTSNFLGVWGIGGTGKYELATMTEGYTIPSSPANPKYTPAFSADFAQDNGVGYTSSYSVTANDFGSPGSTTFSGTQQIPIIPVPSPTPGPGTYNPPSGAGGSYTFNSGDAGKTVVISYTAYRYEIIDNELASVPLTGPYKVTVEYQTAFRSDAGVTYYPSGVALTVVSGSPTVTGTYNPNGGNYEFASGDAGQGVTINYSYTDSNTDTNAPNTLNLTYFSGGLGQAPWSYLSSNYPGFALGYSEVAYVASNGMYLGYTNALPQLNFEIAGAYPFGNGVVDANPAVAIYNLMANPTYKLNFPVANIHTSLLGTYSVTGAVTSGTFTSGENVLQSTSGALGTLVGTVTGSNPAQLIGVITGAPTATNTWVGVTSGAVFTPTALPAFTAIGKSSAQAYWAANNFFISSVLDNQSSLMSVIGDWCEAGNTYISWDEGVMKFIPLGDITAVANGFQYTPQTGNNTNIEQPVINLDDNDYFVGSPKDPIVIEQSPWQSRWNRVGVRWSVRSNSYNEDTLQIDDPAAIQQYGLQSENAKDWQFITTDTAAQFAANLRLQRFQAIYTTYKFTLKSNFAFLSPGDIITISDGLLGDTAADEPGLSYMFSSQPVRITKMTDDPKKGIQIEAETFPWSVGTALLANVQAQQASNTNSGQQQDPGDTSTTIVQVPNAGALYQGDLIWIGCNGVESEWGGCQVWVSTDGVTYNFFQQVDTPARIGTLTADFPAFVGNPDDTNTLTVDMLQSNSTLESVSEPTWNAYGTLSAIISPAVNGNTLTATVGANIGTSAIGGGGFEGPLNAGSGSVIPFNAFTPTWTNPNDITGSAGYATATVSLTSAGSIPQPTQFSKYLAAQNFGFSLPTAGIGVIQGIRVTCKAYVSAFSPPTGGTSEPSLGVFLYVNGSLAGTEQVVIAEGPTPPTTPTTYTIGSPTYTWGLSSLTAAQINASTFGLVFIAVMGGDQTVNPSATVDVQDATIEIWWAGGSNGAAWTNPGNVGDVGSPPGYASSTLSGGAVSTLFLGATGFGFNLPFGFTVTGISVTCDAYSSSASSATLGAILYYQGLEMGGAKSVPITNSSATYSFGSATDLWGTQNDMISNAVLNDTTFGVAFIVSDVTGATENIRNVRISINGNLSGEGYSLELVAYENAELVGDDTYALTNIYRGLLGSYSVDHPSPAGSPPVGSTFMRLDNNVLQYQVPPAYRGTDLYFKFLSFNAYGNQLQSLADVPATIVPILTGQSNPGAIDAKSGALTTGTFTNSTLRIDPVINAAHGTFGISNVPQGYAFAQLNAVTGTPVWQPIVTGGGGTGGVSNVFVIAVSANYTAAAWDYLLCNSSSAAFTVTIPLAASNPNTEIVVTKISTDANAISLVSAGSDALGITSISGKNDSVVLVSNGSNAWNVASGWVSPAVDTYIYVPLIAGIYTPLQELYYTKPVRGFTLASSLTGTNSGCRQAPTGSVAVTILKNGSSVGTINFASSSTTPTFTFASPVSWNGSTDSFSLTAPTSQDSTFAGFWAAFLGSRIP